MIRATHLGAVAIDDIEDYRFRRSSTSAVVTFGERRLSRTIVSPFRESVGNCRSSLCGCNSAVCSPTAIAGAWSSSLGIFGGIGGSSQDALMCCNVVHNPLASPTCQL